MHEIAILVYATSDLPDARGNCSSEQQAKIHERLKKARISHQAGVGGELAVAVPVEFLIAIECKRIVTSFYFHNCSQDHLRARDIIPFNPKPAGAGPHKRPAETLEHCTSGDEEETHDEHLRLRQEELQTRKKRLEVQKRALQIHKQEVQIQKEELRIQNEELQIQTEEQKIQLDTVKAKAKPQRKKLKLDPRVGNS
ncbi:hypothetical protein BD779DRAFT_1016673 [Infundibulicybe gibba]|nr:hypothetical protein BD779DRAFT_1016673 [Infundibulicybe gibba]